MFSDRNIRASCATKVPGCWRLQAQPSALASLASLPPLSAASASAASSKESIGASVGASVGALASASIDASLALASVNASTPASSAASASGPASVVAAGVSDTQLPDWQTSPLGQSECRRQDPSSAHPGVMTPRASAIRPRLALQAKAHSRRKQSPHQHAITGQVTPQRHGRERRFDKYADSLPEGNDEVAAKSASE